MPGLYSGGRGIGLARAVAARNGWNGTTQVFRQSTVKRRSPMNRVFRGECVGRTEMGGAYDRIRRVNA